MTLKEYIEASNLTYEAFAQLIPCSSTYPWMIAHGRANPGFRMACRIEAVTGGIVSRTNWYPSETPDDESLEVNKTISEIMKELKK